MALTLRLTKMDFGTSAGSSLKRVTHFRINAEGAHPLLALSGHHGMSALMSAIGGKADMFRRPRNVG